MARGSIDEKLVRSSSQGHLLPNTNRDGAGVIAERMGSAVEALQIPHVASDARVVTVSIGTSTVLPHDGDRSTLFDATDAAMYEAKRLGRNRVESAVYPRVADVVGWACELPSRGQAPERLGNRPRNERQRARGPLARQGWRGDGRPYDRLSMR